MLSYVTAGESHGPYLSAIISGFPANVSLSQTTLLADLAQRQKGYGRGGRMQIETDQVQITSGVRFGQTLGGPIGLLLPNQDFANWQEIMSVWPTASNNASGQLSSAARRKRTVTQPRPGHADLSGALKYGQQQDLRNVLERASARETAMRVAVGSLCRQFLQRFGIEVLGWVSAIGTATIPSSVQKTASGAQTLPEFAKWQDRVSRDPVRTLNDQAMQAMCQEIDRAQAEGTTLGGQIRVVVLGLPIGLGSYVSATDKLDGRLAQALLSINAIKGISFGSGFELGQQWGRATLDPIVATTAGFSRTSNHQGGLEGGMTNGQPLVIDLVMKPIPTQPQGAPTVDLRTMTASRATVQRSDVTAVPAASVIAQNMTAIVLMQAFCDMFGGDEFGRIKAAYQYYLDTIKTDFFEK
ncbi:chorismate synthase [Lapidilactobacillus luobeiensis]|uniref:chorismate synthase n=1 Tax=Lapidilactobacillus luobeiensis TaxID=2950371 RepID=UPI0021C4AD5A|nr:chorismate synthase [Lapidilactobacillus luobeiensis]